MNVLRPGFVALAAALLMMIGCGGPTVESIAGAPGDYDGATVEVSGRVGDFRTLPALGPKSPGATLYALESGKSLVWVMRGEESSAAGLPLQYQRITIKARVKSKETLRNQTYEPLLVELSAEQEQVAEAPRSVTAP